MKEDYCKCLEKNKLRKIEPEKHIAEKELKESLYDLEMAGKEEEDYKWNIIKAYYSCFHAARCLLFLVGLKENSHFCIYAALKVIFSEDFTDEELSSYKTQLDRREAADYHSIYSKEEAESAVDFAEKFVKKVKFIYEKSKIMEISELKGVRDSI